MSCVCLCECVRVINLFLAIIVSDVISNVRVLL